MAVITTINRKGGSGKTTLATHVAVALAQRIPGVMLVDTDLQQSMGRWLQRRRVHRDRIQFDHTYTDSSRLQRPPAGIRHSVVDTPGSLRGYELAKLLLMSDLVLVPVVESVFDLESSADCLDELQKHSKVARGRVKVAVVGMKAPPGSSIEHRLREWASAHHVPYLGSIRPSRLYDATAAHGLSALDDVRGSSRCAEKEEWRLITDRLEDLLTRHSLEREAAKRRTRMQGHGESTFGDSVFVPSTFVPVERLTQTASLVTRAPGARRSMPDHSLINRVLGVLPEWLSRNRTQPLI